MSANPTEYLFQIYGSYFVAGIAVRHGRVVDAPPLLRWTIGKRLREVVAYGDSKGWVIRCISETAGSKHGH